MRQTKYYISLLTEDPLYEIYYYTVWICNDECLTAYNIFYTCSMRHFVCNSYIILKI